MPQMPLFPAPGHGRRYEMAVEMSPADAEPFTSVTITVKSAGNVVLFQRTDRYVGAEGDYLPTVSRECFSAWLFGEGEKRLRFLMKGLKADAKDYAESLGKARG